MPIEFLISALVTLLVVVDPVGLVPSFLTTTNGLPATLRRRVAVRACLIAGAILIGTALIGDWLLRQLGITLPAFRIAGGLLLFAVAFEMVLGLRTRHATQDAEQAVEEHFDDIAAFPLAIPLMAGPGAITAIILLAGRANGQLTYLSALIALIALGVTSCFVVFMAADRVSRWLGVTGNIVLSRLLGVILAGLAVQFIINGVEALVRPNL